MRNDLTIAICSYNSEKYIEETLQCIIDQTFQNFDLLIVNYCSTDDTVNVSSVFLDKAGRQYRFVHFEENKGLAGGRAYVEQNVETRYILFIDSDDCPKPDLVEKLYNKITSDKDLIAVGCHHSFIDSNSKAIGGGIFLGAKTKEEFYEKARNKKLIFMQPTAIIDREAVLRVGGRNITGFLEGKPRYQDLCEDLDLWTRMSDLYTEWKAIVVVPEVLCRYRKHNQGLSASSLGMNLRMKHIKKNLLLRRENKAELSFNDFYNSLSKKEIKEIERKSKSGDLLRNGVILIKKGNVLKGAIDVLSSIVLNPKYFIQKLKANTQLFK